MSLILGLLAVAVLAAAVVSLILWTGWRVAQCCPECCTDDTHASTDGCDYSPTGRLADRSFRGFVRDLRAACTKDGVA